MNDTNPSARTFARALNDTNPQKLPSLPWKSWCRESGIESAEMARTFLTELAKLYYKTSEAALPTDVMQESADLGKDPYVYWIWTVTPDFRLEPHGMSVKDPDQLYLLDVMERFCRDDGRRDLSQLARECMDDRSSYLAAQSDIAEEILLQRGGSGHAS